MALTATRLDDFEVGTFIRQLEDLEQQIDRVERPGQDFANGKFFQVEVLNKPWAKTWTYRQVTYVGAFQMIRNYTTDIPVVDVLWQEFTKRIFKWGGGYNFSDDDVAAVTRMGQSLETEKIYGVNEASDQKLNELIAFGDPVAEMPGFLNHPDCLYSYAPFPLNSAATADQHLSVLHDAANAVVQLTKQVERPNTLLMDLQTYQFLSSQLITIGTTTLNKTVLQHFQETNPYISSIEVCNEMEPSMLREYGVESPRLLIAYDRNPTRIKAKLYQSLTFKEARRVGTDSWARPAVFKYGGLDLRRPYSMHIVELPE